MAKKNYYAVKNGRVPGIYRTWDACREQVQGWPGAVYKGFEKLADAEAFLGSCVQEKERTASQETETAKMNGASDFDGAVAYVDGSYLHATREFSCGVVLFCEGRELHFSEKYADPELAAMRNVAGELKGAELAMSYCVEHQIRRLAIYHDYEGIAKWCTGEWQAKKEGTKQYLRLYQEASMQVEISFHKVKGHSGVTYNEMADQLAKKALGL